MAEMMTSENDYEDLLGQWSDLESGLGIILSSPDSTQEFAHRVRAIRPLDAGPDEARPRCGPVPVVPIGRQFTRGLQRIARAGVRHACAT